VVAGMVKNPWDYPYSSVHAHLSGKDDLGIINPDHLLDLVDDWELYLSQSQNDKVIDLQKHTRTGSPLAILTLYRLLNRCFLGCWPRLSPDQK
jgi:hypothetical protein